jgi:hypothetical protein
MCHQKTISSAVYKKLQNKGDWARELNARVNESNYKKYYQVAEKNHATCVMQWIEKNFNLKN